MKKYCKNCKYGSWHNGCICHLDDDKRKDYFKVNSFTGQEDVIKTPPQLLLKNDKNRDGECPNYKRKWWKILTK